MQQHSIQLFRGLVLQAYETPVTPPVVSYDISDPVQMLGNTLRWSAYVRNASSLLGTGSALTVVIRGSYDGNTWYAVWSYGFTAAEVGSQRYLTPDTNTSGDNWVYPHVKGEITLGTPTGTGDVATVEVDRTVVMSEQG